MLGDYKEKSGRWTKKNTESVVIMSGGVTMALIVWGIWHFILKLL